VKRRTSRITDWGTRGPPSPRDPNHGSGRFASLNVRSPTEAPVGPVEEELPWALSTLTLTVRYSYAPGGSDSWITYRPIAGCVQ